MSGKSAIAELRTEYDRLAPNNSGAKQPSRSSENDQELLSSSIQEEAENPKLMGAYDLAPPPVAGIVVSLDVAVRDRQVGVPGRQAHVLNRAHRLDYVPNSTRWNCSKLPDTRRPFVNLRVATA